MTALIVIMFILQLALTVWAAAITVLYVKLVKTVRDVAHINQDAILQLFDNDSDALHTIRAVMNTVEAVEKEVADYKNTIDEELRKNQENSEFALQTIQQARRIYRQASEIAGQPQLHIDGDAFIQQVKKKIEEEEANEWEN